MDNRAANVGTAVLPEGHRPLNRTLPRGPELRQRRGLRLTCADPGASICLILNGKWVNIDNFDPSGRPFGSGMSPDRGGFAKTVIFLPSLLVSFPCKPWGLSYGLYVGKRHILLFFLRRFNPVHKPKLKNMKRFLVALVIISSTLLFSCSRSVTPDQAANNHYSHCRDMR
jgi:hypothetical protein